MASEKKRKQADFDILSKIQAEKTKRGWSEYTLSKNSGIPQTTISTVPPRTEFPSDRKFAAN